jgi:hypothetical protein
MSVSVKDLEDFLGIDLGKAAAPQEEGFQYEGWAASGTSPMWKALRGLFPITEGTASLLLASETFWCTAPTRYNPAYHPAIFVALEVRGCRSPVQQVLAAGAPVLRDGYLDLGKKKVETMAAFRRRSSIAIA